MPLSFPIGTLIGSPVTSEQPASISGLVRHCVAAFALVCCFDGHAVAAAHSSQPRHHLESCADVFHYYQGTENLVGARLQKKLYKIIRNHHVVPYDQTWNALKLLDAADDESPQASTDVVEIYSQKAVSKTLAGKLDGWNREHLWPSSYGLRRGRAEFSDLHNLRPADLNVNSARGKKYFGECVRTKDEMCSAPAFKEAAADTATNRRVWMPPLRVRGDVARSLLYMAVRYGTNEPSMKLHLQLSDTPNEEKARMGLLSVLLRWHVQDPPSEEERLRNSRLCALFQHNRNPFVDHPEFASRIWSHRAQ